MKKHIFYGMIVLAAAGSLTSCSWDDPEPVNNYFDNITEVNPPAYTEYLKNLRAYRDNGHKKAYVWFDNKESFSSQADHVATVPDSIDVLVLNHPEIMTQAVLDEIDSKRSNTGMQMAYAISYPQIRKSWELEKELGSTTAWESYRDAELSKQLEYFNNGGFDRIICVYEGKDISTLTDSQKKEYIADQEAFLTPFKNWAKSHVDKGFDFQGIPTNVTDTEVLGAAGTIFLSETLTATNISEMKFIMMRNEMTGIPSEKFAVMTSLPVLDPTKSGLGYWGNDYSSWQTARWARTADVSAIGLINLNDDYYNPDFIYPVTRGAIQILNPAAK